MTRKGPCQGQDRTHAEQTPEHFDHTGLVCWLSGGRVVGLEIVLIDVFLIKHQNVSEQDVITIDFLFTELTGIEGCGT